MLYYFMYEAEQIAIDNKTLFGISQKNFVIFVIFVILTCDIGPI